MEPLRIEASDEPLAPFDALAGQPGLFCALAGRPVATGAPAGVGGLRRTSLAGSRPFARIEVHPSETRCYWHDRLEERLPEMGPAAALEWALGRYALPALAAGDGPPGCAVALSYEALPHFVPATLRRRPEGGPTVPLLVASFYEAVLTHDPQTGAARSAPTGLGHPQAAEPERAAWERASALADCWARRPRGTGGREVAAVRSRRLESSLSEERYRRIIRQAQQYIAAGEIYQANLSQQLRLSLAEGAGPEALWRRLARRHRTGWSAYFDMGPAGTLVSNSPECFLRRCGGRLETFPIKGTRANTGQGAAETLALRADPKELAEHRMIVDLERSDLGRVAAVGSVSVPGREYTESYPTLHHLVSCVRCELPATRGWGEILAALFPGGSVTGAPKRRAIEIIDELEPVARGFYTGVFGTISTDGTAEFSILIRTAHCQGSRLSYSAGGAIVADSDPESEVRESWLKARAFLDACGLEGAAPLGAVAARA